MGTLKLDSSEYLTVILASFSLEECTYRGRVFDLLETNLEVENRFFPGWRNALTVAAARWAKQRLSSLFNIVEDDNRPALEWCTNVPCLLIVGDESWGDYEISVDVRCLMTETFPFFHDEATFDFIGKTGIAFRVQDSRRHYFAGFQGGRELVVAAREDANWIVLNRCEFQTDRRRYYRLRVRCCGADIEVAVDGERRLVAEDSRWKLGPAGVYSTSPARWRDATVRCSPEELKTIEKRRAEQRLIRDAAARAAPPVTKWREIPLFRPVASVSEPVFMDLLGEEPPNILLAWSSGAGRVLQALDLNGKELWRRELAIEGQFLCDTSDIDLDGASEVVALTGRQILVLDGRTGETRAEAEYPPGCPFIRLRGEKAVFGAKSPFIWQTGGAAQPARIYLCEWTGAGGYTIWCYDHQLRFRWKHHNYAGKFGHNLRAYDVNEDGKLEVVAGYYVLDDDGRVVWRVRDQDLIFKQDHTDNLFVGPMGENGGGVPKIVAAAGEAGVIFLDARNGDILAQYRGLGHVQRLDVGKFRHDLPGLQAWLWTDWGSPGIYYLFDEKAHLLHRFQPDPRATDGAAVTWWPDGRQLLLIRGTREVLGLWDGFGRRVVEFSTTPGLSECYMHRPPSLPKGPSFAIARPMDARMDQLLVVDEEHLMIFGPSI